jgi:hypothetical protein
LFSLSVWMPEHCSLQSGVLGSIQDVASSSFYHLIEISAISTSSLRTVDMSRTGLHIATEASVARLTLQPFCPGTSKLYNIARLL